MPHVIMEHSGDLSAKTNMHDVLKRLHAAVRASGLFDPDAIKSRSKAYRHYLVGDRQAEGSFVHVTVSILSGRSTSQRQALGQAVLDVLEQTLAGVGSLTADIREMDKETYFKNSG